jgi:hypothetical protein
MATFECVLIVPYRLLFPDDKRITELYRGVLAPGNRNPAFNLSPKHVDILGWSTYFPETLPKQKSEPPEQTIDKLQPAAAKHKPATTNKLTPTDLQVLELISIIKPEFSEADLAESVIMPAANNPGFDMVFFEKETGGVDCMYCNYYIACLPFL